MCSRLINTSRANVLPEIKSALYVNCMETLPSLWSAGKISHIQEVDKERSKTYSKTCRIVISDDFLITGVKVDSAELIDNMV